jgi:hypothetical protein
LAQLSTPGILQYSMEIWRPNKTQFNSYITERRIQKTEKLN